MVEFDSPGGGSGGTDEEESDSSGGSSSTSSSTSTRRTTSSGIDRRSRETTDSTDSDSSGPSMDSTSSNGASGRRSTSPSVDRRSQETTDTQRELDRDPAERVGTAPQPSGSDAQQVESFEAETQRRQEQRRQERQQTGLEENTPARLEDDVERVTDQMADRGFDQGEYQVIQRGDRLVAEPHDTAVERRVEDDISSESGLAPWEVEANVETQVSDDAFTDTGIQDPTRQVVEDVSISESGRVRLQEQQAQKAREGVNSTAARVEEPTGGELPDPPGTNDISFDAGDLGLPDASDDFKRDTRARELSEWLTETGMETGQSIGGTVAAGLGAGNGFFRDIGEATGGVAGGLPGQVLGIGVDVGDATQYIVDDDSYSKSVRRTGEVTAGAVDQTIEGVDNTFTVREDRPQADLSGGLTFQNPVTVREGQEASVLGSVLVGAATAGASAGARRLTRSRSRSGTTPGRSGGRDGPADSLLADMKKEVEEFAAADRAQVQIGGSRRRNRGEDDTVGIADRDGRDVEADMRQQELTMDQQMLRDQRRRESDAASDLVDDAGSGDAFGSSRQATFDPDEPTPQTVSQRDTRPSGQQLPDGFPGLRQRNPTPDTDMRRVDSVEDMLLADTAVPSAAPGTATTAGAAGVGSAFVPAEGTDAEVFNVGGGLVDETGEIRPFETPTGAVEDASLSVDARGDTASVTDSAVATDQESEVSAGDSAFDDVGAGGGFDEDFSLGKERVTGGDTDTTPGSDTETGTGGRTDTGVTTTPATDTTPTTPGRFVTPELVPRPGGGGNPIGGIGGGIGGGRGGGWGRPATPPFPTLDRGQRSSGRSIFEKEEDEIFASGILGSGAALEGFSNGDGDGVDIGDGWGFDGD